MKNNRQLLTLEGASELSGLSVTTLREYINKGLITAQRGNIMHNPCIKKESLIRYLNNKQCQGRRNLTFVEWLISNARAREIVIGVRNFESSKSIANRVSLTTSAVQYYIGKWSREMGLQNSDYRLAKKERGIQLRKQFVEKLRTAINTAMVLKRYCPSHFKHIFNYCRKKKVSFSPVINEKKKRAYLEDGVMRNLISQNLVLVNNAICRVYFRRSPILPLLGRTKIWLLQLNRAHCQDCSYIIFVTGKRDLFFIPSQVILQNQSGKKRISIFIPVAEKIRNRYNKKVKSRSPWLKFRGAPDKI